MLCWSLIPFDFNIVISDLNLGLLFLFAFSSLGVYGIIISGWSSNSKYAFLGAYDLQHNLLVMKFLWVLLLCQLYYFRKH